MEQLQKIEGERMQYLAMIQSAIDRMSSTSSVLKGFAATVLTGIAALTVTDICNIVLILSVLPVLSFLMLDVFYLRLERRFRYLYEQVRLCKRDVDFSMNIRKTKDQEWGPDATIWQCLISPSIWMFYLPAIAILLAICIMRSMEVI